MRRVLSLFLPCWPIDRLRRATREGCGEPADERPLATVCVLGGRRLLAAVDRAAAAAGLAPGMPLADAFAFLPGLATLAAAPEEDAASLRRLAEWCGRYSPWTTPDGADGVAIEITGSAHLWGGERALAEDLARRLARWGIAARIAVAATRGAAWALARFAGAESGPVILPPGDAAATLAPLPVEALRLDPASVRGLRRVGLRHVGELMAMPCAALAARFGAGIARRLDQALDREGEPLSPCAEIPARRVRLGFADAIADPADLARAIDRLCADLAHRLAREGTGARRLALACHRLDGRVEHIRLGLARPSRDPDHLAGLLKARLETIDPGIGIEDMILAVFAAEPLAAEQPGLADDAAGAGLPADTARLLDRLASRLGPAALCGLAPRESHIPERASLRVPPSPASRCSAPSPALREREGAHRGSDGKGEGTSFRRVPPRPIRLFDPPEPIAAAWLLPDDPPFHFTWRRRRHRVARAEGPERIAEEWWRAGAVGTQDAIRDYYRVEDEEGRRLWLFRAGLAGHRAPPRWYVHGLFA